jgi:hypothetical protein
VLDLKALVERCAHETMLKCAKHISRRVATPGSHSQVMIDIVVVMREIIL